MKSADKIELTAAQLLRRREQSGWTDEDEQALQSWAAEDRAHHIAMLRLSTVWTKADRLRVAKRDEATHKRGKRWFWPMALAASVALVALPAYQYMTAAEAYTTAVGGFQHIPLADGSLIDLNTNSRVLVDYSPMARRVALDQGEAYFTVAKNAERPFVVESDHWRVIAVGTAFAVKTEADRLDVVVTEGRVRIEALGDRARSIAPIFVSAGQSVRVGATQTALPTVQPLEAEYMEAALGWRDGLLTFEARPLADVVLEMNRYNKIQIIVDSSAADMVIDGSFRTTNIDGFLRLLKEGFAVEVEREGNERVFIRKSKNI